MPFLFSQAYQVRGLVDANLASKQRTNLRGEPDVPVREAPKRIE